MKQSGAWEESKWIGTKANQSWERGDGVCRVNHGHEPHGVVCLGTIQGWRDKDNENDKKKNKTIKAS